MSARPVIQPFEVFRDVDGTPLESGAIYIGTVNLDPVANPVPVFWDEALTIAAAQPITTINGYPSRGGSPSRFFCDSNYSILVRNKRGEFVFSAGEVTDSGVGDSDTLRSDLANTADPAKGAALLGYKSPLTGGVGRTAYSKFQDTISAFDFMTAAQIADVKAGTLLEDVTTAVQAALDYCKTAGGHIHFPAGQYKITSSLDYYVAAPYGITLTGDGNLVTRLVYDVTKTDSLFDNTQSPAAYQYGLRIADMTLATFAAGAAVPVSVVRNPTAITVHYLQRQWSLERVNITGFATGVVVGEHSEAGQMVKCQFGYNNVGVDLAGNNADLCRIESCWFYNQTINLMVSSPRARIVNNFFGKITGYYDTGHIDIQIGYRSTDGAGAGNKCLIRGNEFESGDSMTRGSIVIDYFSGTGTTTGLDILDNNFAIYSRPCAIELNKLVNNLKIKANRLSTNSGSVAPLVLTTLAVIGKCAIDNPEVVNEFADLPTAWSFGKLTKSEYTAMPETAEQITGASWSTSANTSQTCTETAGPPANIKLDYTGSGSTWCAKMTRTSCPVGMVTLNLDTLAPAGEEGCLIQLKAMSGATTIFHRLNIPVNNLMKNEVFSFYNASIRTVDIYVYITPTDPDATGTIYLYNPEVKLRP